MKIEEIKEKIKKTIRTDIENKNEYIAFGFIAFLIVLMIIICVIIIKNR